MKKKNQKKLFGIVFLLTCLLLISPVQVKAAQINLPNLSGITNGLSGNTGTNTTTSGTNTTGTTTSTTESGTNTTGTTTSTTGSSTATGITGKNLTTTYTYTITSVAKNLKQVDSGVDSITFSWDRAAGYTESKTANIYYYIEIANDTSFKNTIEKKGPEMTNKCQFGSLSAGTTYYVRVGACYRDYKISSLGYTDVAEPKWSATLKVVTAPDGNVKIKTTAATTTSLKVSWNKVPGANGYQVYYWKYLGESISDAKNVIVSGNSKEIKNLTKNTKYSFRVYALRTSGTYTAQGAYGELFGMSVKPTKVSGVKVTRYCQDVSLHKFRYENDPKESADIYQYRVCRYNDDVIATGKTTSTNLWVNKSAFAKSGNVHCFYYIQVRAGAKLSNGKYSWGSWSNKYYFNRLDGTNVKVKKSGKGMKVSWKKEKGATGYVIYVGRSASYTSNVTYHKVATISKGKTTSKKLSASLLKKKKVPFSKGKYYFVRVVAVKKVGNKTYKSVVESKTYSAYAWYTKDKKWRMYTAV